MAAPVGANDANIGAQVPPKLYWIDQFCDEAAGGNFEKIHVLEARRWAKRTYERLSSDTDTDFARIFNLIFKTPKTDATLYPRPKYWQQTHGNNIDEWRTSYQHVFHVLYDFAHNDRKPSYASTPDPAALAAGKHSRRGETAMATPTSTPSTA
jgi:hypothetical protein